MGRGETRETWQARLEEAPSGCRPLSGVIFAHALTEAAVDDATTGIRLIEATDGDLARGLT